MHLTRRGLLKGLGGAAALGALGGHTQDARAQAAASNDPRFLIVIGCFGGASIIDAAPTAPATANPTSCMSS